MFWKRYVDDVISAVSKNEVEKSLCHLNSVEPSIQLTVEREKDRRLSFLELNACRTDHGNLETGIYRKHTHADKYLAFDSHQPICNKMSVTKTLFMIAEYLPSSSDSKAFERICVIDVLKENNYPKDFLQNCLKPVHPSRKTTVPYIHGVTEPIKRILCIVTTLKLHKNVFDSKSYFCKTKGSCAE